MTPEVQGGLWTDASQGCKIVMEQERLIEGDFQVLGDSSSSNGVDTPQVGMCFSAEEEVRDFYKSYAQILGFGIAKLGSKKGDDGPLKYFSFGCSKNVFTKNHPERLDEGRRTPRMLEAEALLEEEGMRPADIPQVFTRCDVEREGTDIVMN
ncbi:hypothetical protein ZIOFF_008670 [Zingiber officinale]|uniref:FAR1-related protein n=1 Tax=Zingiber officinale TaxID=94328 RepID=A0A8J5HZ69_ZINOF|nr:hypothetical protein ZIOFF_008670 [Zingiber officinale]